MFGIVFIVVGIILLLEAMGVFGSLSMGVIWGIAFILIGIVVAMRHSMRRGRREEWMARRREGRQGGRQDESEK